MKFHQGFSAKTRFLLVGIAFGTCFPIIAAVIRTVQYGFSALSAQIANDPLLWIIFTAPVFLGGAAYIAGTLQHKAEIAKYGWQKKRHRCNEKWTKVWQLLRRNRRRRIKKMSPHYKQCKRIRITSKSASILFWARCTKWLKGIDGIGTTSARRPHWRALQRL